MAAAALENMRPAVLPKGRSKEAAAEPDMPTIVKKIVGHVNSGKSRQALEILKELEHLLKLPRPDLLCTGRCAEGDGRIVRERFLEFTEVVRNEYPYSRSAAEWVMHITTKCRRELYQPLAEFLELLTTDYRGSDECQRCDGITLEASSGRDPFAALDAHSEARIALVADGALARPFAGSMAEPWAASKEWTGAASWTHDIKSGTHDTDFGTYDIKSAAAALPSFGDFENTSLFGAAAAEDPMGSFAAAAPAVEDDGPEDIVDIAALSDGESPFSDLFSGSGSPTRKALFDPGSAKAEAPTVPHQEPVFTGEVSGMDGASADTSTAVKTGGTGGSAATASPSAAPGSAKTEGPTLPHEKPVLTGEVSGMKADTSTAVKTGGTGGSAASATPSPATSPRPQDEAPVASKNVASPGKTGGTGSTAAPKDRGGSPFSFGRARGK